MQPPQQRRPNKLAGIILFSVFVFLVAMIILVGFLSLGAVVSAFNSMTGNLNSNALNVYNALKTAAVNAYALAATLILVAAVGTLVIAIFSLKTGSEF